MIILFVIVNTKLSIEAMTRYDSHFGGMRTIILKYHTNSASKKKAYPRVAIIMDLK